ncbi:MAG: SBBP repeat-containing protein [Bacteroidetes bacterium]|nr:SBBP repeat-containing protein [Bacteroidota bacterium]
MKQFFWLFILIIFFINVIYAQLTPSIDWLKIYDGIGKSIDMTNDAKVDRNYNIYLAGRSSGIDGSQDLLILKYSRLGELISEIRYVSAPSSGEEANSIAIDSSNNLYCIGSASFGTSSFFTIIQKYSPNGVLSWNKNFYNTSDQYSEGITITVDKENNVIAGYHLNGACFTKYTSFGDSLWSATIADDTSRYALDYITTDKSNNIYVAYTEYYSGEGVPNPRIHTYKYDKNGKIIWHKTFNGIYTEKIVLDKTNNIIQLVITSESGVIIKMNQTGEIEWENNSGILILTDVSVDFENNILVTGYGVTSNSFDYFTKKYSENGIDEWTQIFNGAENLKDYAMALAIDNFNSIYVTGSTNNSISQGVSYTVKYSKDGELLWQQKFDALHSIFENSNFESTPKSPKRVKTRLGKFVFSLLTPR